MYIREILKIYKNFSSRVFTYWRRIFLKQNNEGHINTYDWTAKHDSIDNYENVQDTP